MRSGGNHLGERIDVASIQSVKLLNVSEDLIELAAICLYFVLGEFEVRQIGNVEHGFTRDFHGKRTSVANFARASRKRPQAFGWKEWKLAPALAEWDGADIEIPALED